MANKRSEWMRGLLECEQFIQHTDPDCAKFYWQTELGDDSNEFQCGWLDAIAHYKRVAAQKQEAKQ